LVFEVVTLLILPIKSLVREMREASDLGRRKSRMNSCSFLRLLLSRRLAKIRNTTTSTGIKLVKTKCKLSQTSAQIKTKSKKTAKISDLKSRSSFFSAHRRQPVPKRRCAQVQTGKDQLQSYHKTPDKSSKNARKTWKNRLPRRKNQAAMPEL
jgi:hypothetical protein